MKLFSYDGAGCNAKPTAVSCTSKSPLFESLAQPTLNSVGSGVSGTISNTNLSNLINYEATLIPDGTLGTLQNNAGTIKRVMSPLSGQLGNLGPTSPIVSEWDKIESNYSSLRRDNHILKPVPPPTIPVSTSTPSHTRTKKTVTICDTTEIGRASSPLAVE